MVLDSAPSLVRLPLTADSCEKDVNQLRSKTASAGQQINIGVINRGIHRHIRRHLTLWLAYLGKMLYFNYVITFVYLHVLKSNVLESRIAFARIFS